MTNKKSVDTSKLEWIDLSELSEEGYVINTSKHLNDYIIGEGDCIGMVAGYYQEDPFIPGIELFIFHPKSIKITKQGVFYFTQNYLYTDQGYWVFETDKYYNEYGGIARMDYDFKELNSTVEQWQIRSKELKIKIDENKKLIDNHSSYSCEIELITKTRYMMDELGMIQDNLFEHLHKINEKGEEIAKKILRLLELKCNEIDIKRRNKYDEQIQELNNKLSKLTDN